MSSHSHCDHNHDPHEEERIGAPKDPAAESLANALRVSFRLLSVIILIMLGLYLFSGVRTIDANQVGVKTVFGKVVGEVQPGLAYTWPFPVGDIQVVDTRTQELEINDFYMFLTPEQLTQKLEEITPAAGGLRPALDGALLTGDRSLLHAKLVCKYRVTEPILYLQNVSDLGETIRSVICAETIRAAATQTADALQRSEEVQGAFKQEVIRGAADRLRKLGAGITIEDVVIKSRTWPLAALPAFNAASGAIERRRRLEDSARADAASILRKAAGNEYPVLVGEPGEVRELPLEGPIKDRNLIGQYQAAKNAGLDDRAGELLVRINETLTDRSLVSGEASGIIAQAESARTTIVQVARQQVTRFRKILEEFDRSNDPDAFVGLLWEQVRNEILSSPLVEKSYVTQGQQKIVLRVRRDPQIQQNIEMELLKRAREQKDKQSGTPGR
ncbi:MAG TPA: hypothetical protein DCX07_05450 [Phycisphaerales bacterium]|nr:hypothetical protein [Phycisphaerales bacterium]